MESKFKEFNISLQYIDPKFYQKDNIDGFMSECEYSRKLEVQSAKAEILRRIKFDFKKSGDRNSSSICDHSNFDPLFQLCSVLPSLVKSQKLDLLRLIRDTISTLICSLSDSGNKCFKDGEEHKTTARNSIKMLSFLLCTAINVCEKAEAKLLEDIDWDFEKEKILGVVISVLHSPHVKKLWNLNTPEEEFGNMFFKTSMNLLENDKNRKSLTSVIFKMIGLNMQQNSFLQLTFSVTFTHMLLNKEKMASKVADLCLYLVENFSLTDVVGNILREIGRLDTVNLSKNIKGAESIGTFLVELARKMPFLVYNEINVLLSFMNGSCYKMRNGVIELIAQLLLNFDAIVQGRKDSLCSGKIFKRRRKRKAKDKEQGGADSGEDVDILQAQDHKKSDTENDAENDEADKDFNNKEIDVERDVMVNLERLLGNIEERCLDVISFTRSKALAVLKNLVDQQAIPSSDRLISIIKICKSRLKERNANVRKNAVGLLTLMIERNYPENPIKFKKRREKLASILEILGKAEKSISAPEKACVEVKKNIKQSKKLSEESREKLLTEHESVSKACEFMDEISACFPIICDILTSKGNFDVLECINFFRIASEHNIDGWKLGFKKMFSLVWNKETPNIVDAVIDAYYDKYIKNKENEKDNIEESCKTAYKLALLISEMESHKELTCIEEIIAKMCLKEMIPDRVISALSRNFMAKNRQIGKELELDAADEKERTKFDFLLKIANNSLYILSIVASVKPALIVEHLDAFVTILGEYFVNPAREFDVRMRGGVVMIKYFAAIVEKCQKKSKIEDEIKEKIVTFARKILLDTKIEENSWLQITQQLVATLFSLLCDPDEFFEILLREYFSQSDISDSLRLTRFMFLLGNVSICILAYMERQEHRLKALKSKKDKIENILEAEEKPKKSNSVLSDYYKMNEGEKEYQIEQMKEKAEERIVNSDLIGNYCKMVVYICRHLSEIKKRELKCSTVLAFCKFMCISKSFCIENLTLLFEIMEKSEDSVLTTNIIIALGDIAFRFPNLIAPYISKMFAPLHHKEVSVRKNTLLVVSHLILNDMIKVKESISEITLAITDEEKTIRDLAKLFFQEFSKKGKNPVYNTLPDIISKLTHDKVDKMTFETILKELIRYISEEKQQENLIFKICSRFSKLQDEEQIQNNMYCLTLLNYGERCIKKFFEMAKTYKNFLGDKKILECFKIILSKAKKTNSKQDVKNLISDFENKILKQQLGQDGEENEEKEIEKNKKDENLEDDKQRKNEENFLIDQNLKSRDIVGKIKLPKSQRYKPEKSLKVSKRKLSAKKKGLVGQRFMSNVDNYSNNDDGGSNEKIENGNDVEKGGDEENINEKDAMETVEMEGNEISYSTD